MKRRSLIVLLVVVLLLAAVAAMLMLGSPAVGRDDRRVAGTVRLLVPWTDARARAAIEQELNLFSEIYPDVAVVLLSEPLGDINQRWIDGTISESAELAIYSADLPADRFSGKRFPWTGAIWSLYANRSLLEQTALWQDERGERLRSGEASLEEFTELLEALSALGVPPVSAGAQFTWPLTAWLQHIALSLGYDVEPSADAAASPAAFADALAVWQRWEETGFIAQDWRSVDWPESLRRVREAEAAMVLLAGTLASDAISGERWALLPFPHGAGESWTVGSIWSLGIPAATEDEAGNAGAAELLAEFLTSEGVTGRLSRAIGVRFFSRTQDGSPGRVVASLTSVRESPFSQRVAAYLNE